MQKAHTFPNSMQLFMQVTLTDFAAQEAMSQKFCAQYLSVGKKIRNTTGLVKAGAVAILQISLFTKTAIQKRNAHSKHIR